MQNNLGEDQYKLNRWQQFTDRKITQFFQKHLKQYDQLKNSYIDFINVLSMLIVKFTYKKSNHLLMILVIVVTSIHMILTFVKKFQKISILLNHILDFMILVILLGVSRENETEFIIRLCFQIAIQTSKLMIFQYNQFEQAIENVLKIGIVTVLKWQFIQDYSIQKLVIFITLTIFYQAIISVITLAYSYSYKNLWINLEKIKKTNQISEKLFFELPFAVIIFNQDGTVYYQNSISFKFLPKAVDLITKNYSNEISKFQDLILNEEDKKKFAKAFQEAIESDETILISFAFQGHPIPIRCQLKKKVLNKSQIIEAIFQEKSDDQSIVYDRITQSLQIIKIQQVSEILSKQQEKIKLSLLQTLFPMCSSTDYQKTDQIVCNLKNYFKFLADFLQIVYQISPNVKFENEFPDQQFVDIVKLHSILTQIIYYIFIEHAKQKICVGQSQNQLMLLSSNEKVNHKENHNFSLISFLINNSIEKLEVTLQVDYHYQIQEQERMFQKFDLELLKNFESRMVELLKDDLKYTGFIHIIHQIYSIDGELELKETLDNIKIQLNFPTRIVKDYENPIFENYNSMGKFDTLSKIYSINNDNFQALRVKSSAQITSTQRIQPLVNQKTNEDNVRVQTSLSDHNLNYYKCEDVGYRPKMVSEEEKQDYQQDHNQLISPNLSPINKPSNLKQVEVANFDIEDRINNQMPSVEKAVSKVLEQVLSEIMTFKGRRINVHFRNSKSKQKSFETSPSNSSVPKQSQRNTSVPNLQQFRTPIPEQKEQTTQQQISNQQQSQPQQQQQQAHQNCSMFKQNASQQQQNQLHQAQQPQNQPIINKRNQGTQLLKSLRETDQGKQILNLEQSDQFGPYKQEENQDDLRNSVRFIATSEDHQIQKSQHSQTSLSTNVQQGSEKSPCFKVQKQVTVNDIETQPLDSLNKDLDLKKCLNEQITIMVVDDSQQAINNVQSMKLKKPFVVVSSSKSEDAQQLIEKQLISGKIFHLILIKIKMPTITGIDLVKTIREFERKYNLPRQIIIGVDSELNENIKSQSLNAGFDDLQEKPLRQFTIEKNIEKIIKQSPESVPKNQEEIDKLLKAQAQLDELQFPEKISSFQEIPIKSIQPVSRKQFYNEVATIFLFDDSGIQINALIAMKFDFTKKVDYSRKIDDGLKKIEAMLQKKKIFHIILININLCENNGEKILNSIRNYEIEQSTPKQFIVGIDSDFTDERKDQSQEYVDERRNNCLKIGYDSTLKKLIDSRLLGEIIRQRIQDD